MPRPKKFQEVDLKLAEIWSNNPNSSATAIHAELVKEPISPPKLRYVQYKVAELKAGAGKLEPQTELRLWEHDWYNDPEKAPVLLALHYVLTDVEGSDSTGMYVEEAKWALKIARFFDLSSSVHAYLLFRFAATYANGELIAKLLGRPFDTRELDTALLEFSGLFRGERPKVTLWLVRDFLSDLKRLRPEYLKDPRTEQPGFLGYLEDSVVDEGNSDVTTGIDRWKRLEWELAKIERERFIAEGRLQASENTDWERSADKTYFENQENDIRSRAADLYATPEGKTAYDLFVKGINVQNKLQFP